MDTLVKKRDPFLDIIKAIGIISIVMGHSSAIIPLFGGKYIPIGAFVYCYHILVFMFIPGFLLKESDGKNPAAYLGKTILSNWKLFIYYSVFFVAAHNLLLSLDMISGTPHSLSSAAGAMVRSVIFQIPSTLLGAFWFVPMYIFAIWLFSFVFSLAEKTKRPLVFHILFMVGFALFGLLLHEKEVYMSYHVHTSFLAVPICYLGFFAKRYFHIVKKGLTWYGCILSAAALFAIVSVTKKSVDLASNSLLSPALFYPVTIIGIYFCLCLSTLLCKVKYLNTLLAYIGKNSFHIMALHFLAFKVVDTLWGHITQQDPALIAKFPVAFKFWGLYYVVGVFFPLIVPFLSVYIKRGLLRLKELVEARFAKPATELEGEPEMQSATDPVPADETVSSDTPSPAEPSADPTAE